MLLDPELMKKTGIFALVSGELVAFIGGGYWLGKELDKRWNTSPTLAALLACMGLSYAVWRMNGLSKKWMKK